MLHSGIWRARSWTAGRLLPSEVSKNCCSRWCRICRYSKSSFEQLCLLQRYLYADYGEAIVHWREDWLWGTAARFLLGARLVIRDKKSNDRVSQNKGLEDRMLSFAKVLAALKLLCGIKSRVSKDRDYILSVWVDLDTYKISLHFQALSCISSEHVRLECIVTSLVIVESWFLLIHAPYPVESQIPALQSTSNSCGTANPIITIPARKVKGMNAFCKSVLLTKVNQQITKTKPKNVNAVNHHMILMRENRCNACNPQPSAPVLGESGVRVDLGIIESVIEVPATVWGSCIPMISCSDARAMCTTSDLCRLYS